MDEIEGRMEAEPRVEFEGRVSDGSEHRPMLDNPEANKYADQLAIEAAREIGISEEDIQKYMVGPTDIDFLD